VEPVLTGFERPVDLTHAGVPSQVFVAEQAGRVYLVEEGQIQPQPFLDIVERVSCCGERGLLSIAFPTDYGESGLFYINYTDRRGDTVVARYRVQEEDRRQADRDSEQVILRIEQPAANHNGGQLQFGPDGALYVGTGDGGEAGDPWGNAQNGQVLLGKILRLAVTGVDGYEIPPDNPFTADSAVRAEIWALGLRNPWRFSFDRETGDLFVGDVGQAQYEEIDFQPAGSPGGENYGWDVMEGAHCFEPSTGCQTEGLVTPVAEYAHDQGCSVTGGYVYRGDRYPSLQGVYFYADYCSGHVWAMRQNASGEWDTALVLRTGLRIASFGQDAGGTLYLLDYGGGVVYRLVGAP
jgi:glucose/arabinose dehydrogenase